MSSSPLYLAIVVVWLIVLVPMLLRKDSVETVNDDQRREDGDAEDGFEGPAEDEEDPDLTETQVIHRDDLESDPGVRGAEEIDLARGRYRAAREPRARVIARRRRRTSVLTLVNVATVVAVAFGLGPWWVIAPPVLLLTGHLVLLREAAKADSEYREAAERARRRAVLRARRAEEEQRVDAEREAKVIALRERRSQVYDQYADARLRAAGD
ncbi:hypothetical protein Q8791_04685 [Nocardiopsis sp. CT-R113]|uniref:Uncharacterized protein n=1 Tax=Nocardiopsis codii TaxID=3065942 RepID=A0ABU7K2Q3_9ACTN|nr:hypothetical protein [Nocardiopsis sp. CT-R113]MEE2036518.1 hypothetical protein [Nocardiopsis sp. CT-R113]